MLSKSSVSFKFDCTGFPMVSLDTQGWAIQLLPVSKWQLERLVAMGRGMMTDAAYDELLQLNPRTSWRNHNPAQRDGLWLTGITVTEARYIAKWFGIDHRLPNNAEWLAAFKTLQGVPWDVQLFAHITHFNGCHTVAKQILTGLLANDIKSNTLADIALFQGGVVEWLDSAPHRPCGLGSPRPQLQPNLWGTTPVKPIRPDVRLRYFGMRVITHNLS